MPATIKTHRGEVPAYEYGDDLFPDGSTICVDGLELRCDRGVWAETGAYGAAQGEPDDYIRISADGLRSSRVNNHGYELSPVRFTLGAPLGEVRLYNASGVEMSVDIMWSDGVPQTVDIAPRGHIDIPQRAQASQIVGAWD